MDKGNIDVGGFIETGAYNNDKVHLPLPFNQALQNNIQEDIQFKHKTPLGAGTIIWANNKVVL